MADKTPNEPPTISSGSDAGTAVDRCLESDSISTPVPAHATLQSAKSDEKPAAPPQGLPPPPDGGLVAWLQCAGGFTVFFNTWGLLNSFGVFQAFYSQGFIQDHTNSDISWIGTIQSCFIMLGSVYSGPLYDWGYLRQLVAVGSFLVVFGMFMTSLCTQYWQLMLAQGLVMGLGTGCLFMPTAGIIATYFGKKRGLAMGIASSGSTIGGIIYPVAFSRLVESIGFGWASRVVAFIMLALMVLPVATMKMRFKPPAVRKLFDARAWQEPEFALYAACLFIGYVGMYVPYFYIQIFCSEKEIVTGDLNFYLLPIMNAAGFFGRLFFGHLADNIGPLNAYTICSGCCAVLLFGWMGVVNEAGAIVFVVFYGFFSAGLIILPATVVAMVLCPDMRQYGVRMTMQLVPSAIGLLIGNPIAGAILQRSWLGLQGFSVATVVICTLLLAAARVSRTGFKFMAKL